MTLVKVTSLADLVFKAKSDKYYKQLALLGARRCCNSDAKARALTTHEKVIEFLYTVSANHNPDSCSAVVQEINSCCHRIVEEIEPTPPVEGTTTPSGAPVIDNNKLKEMVTKLKKKAVTSTKKSSAKARGARSSTRSRTPTRQTRARSTRRSNANGRNT